MPIDRESKQNLIKRIIKESEVENDGSLSDEKRLSARRKRKFYNTVLNRLKDGQSTDSNQ
jgi:hypothetical protein